MRSMTRLDDDRGAVATIVCILLTTAVFFSLGALTLDMGLVYAERREIQNGADAGALALAQSCADDAPDCVADTSPSGTPGTYADANALDGTTLVTDVCGAGRPTLPACAATSGHWTDCLAVPASGTNYVQVRTRTRMATTGSTFFPRFFARALTGFETDPGTPVPACARAVWGGVQSLTGGIALTISECNWEEMTDPDGDGIRNYAPYPPPPSPSFERTIGLHNTPNTPTCTTTAPGTAPGGFGWLDDGTPQDCATDINVTDPDPAEGDPGLPASSECKDVLLDHWTSREPVFLPIFTQAVDNGSKTEYTLNSDGLAAFVITGYRLPGAVKSSWLPGSTITPCTGSDKCIYGFFVDAPPPSSMNPVIGGPGMGATAVAMTG